MPVLRLAFALVPVFAFVGCTGGDEPPLSSAQFAREASAVCGRFVEATRAAEDPHSDDLAANAAYLDEIIPPLEVAVKELQNLTPAEPARAETDALVGRYGRLLQAEMDLREAARSDDMAAFARALRRVIALAYETNSRASELGWTLCAEP